MPNRYSALIAHIFKRHYRPGIPEFTFRRAEIEQAAKRLTIRLPKNLGDILYSFRHRQELPASIRAAAPSGKRWIIGAAGRALYRFRLVDADARIVPRSDRVAVKIPDATPEIIEHYAQSDEQALLAKLRYNRLIDVFLGVTAYSLQSHLRTTVPNRGQVEVDELYVGVNRGGQQFIIPVQAKGHRDQLSLEQADADIGFCRARFPNPTMRIVSAQFMADGTIVLFELTEDGGDIKVVEESHYRLVPTAEISNEDLRQYARS